MSYDYSAPKKVTIFDPQGKAHIDTIPNARDLVNNSGYTWEPGQVGLTPASNAPSKIRPKKTPPISAAQEVLNAAIDKGRAPEADDEGQTGEEQGDA